MKQIKISKTFRLSQEAVDVLENQSNATQFVEDLILQKTMGPSAGQALEKKIDTILEILNRTPEPPTEKMRVSPTANRLSLIYTTIKDREKELAELMEINQDPADHRQLQQEIQGLWNEYHAEKARQQTN